MTKREMPVRDKKAYSTPRLVDFGAIETMTGDCFGFCPDGHNGGMDGDA